MNHRQMIRAVARRFPDLTQRQVEEVLAVCVEVWREALAQPGGEVVLRDFGRLSVDVQRMRSGGIVRARMGTDTPERLTRLYFRFHPVGTFRTKVEESYREDA
ncbi:MAG: HU family DNA-binding protein [Chloroflexi bacterium]|nr:HU family DNA-binding protein [Chloroflexota bacterium]